MKTLNDTSLIGRNITNSNFKDNPMYSFPKGASHQTHTDDTISNSPGVGQYSPEKLKVLKNSPKAIISRNSRFSSASGTLCRSQRL